MPAPSCAPGSPTGATGDPIAGLVEAEAQPDPEEQTDDPASPTTDEFQQTPTSVRSFLDGLEDDSRTLHYLHVLLPHVPFRYLPDGTGYASPDPDLGREGEVWADDPWLAEQARQRHLLQMQYTDALIGRTIDRMQESDLYDEALLVLVADHGISFESGGTIRGLDNANELSPRGTSELLWVPFVVKEPGQREGRVDDRNVSTVDVLPTIADVLDVEVPWELDGRSAFGPERTSTTKGIFRNEVSGVQILAGDLVEVDQDEGFARVLDLGVDQVGQGEGADRLWRIGPDPDLIGQRADELGRRLRAVDARFAPYSGASDVAPDRRRVPALVVAEVPASAGLRPGDAVAVSVDGVVQATGRAFDDGTQVSAMVPAEAFASGPNDVRIHVVAG